MTKPVETPASAPTNQTPARPLKIGITTIGELLSVGALSFRNGKAYISVLASNKRHIEGSDPTEYETVTETVDIAVTGLSGLTDNSIAVWCAKNDPAAKKNAEAAKTISKLRGLGLTAAQIAELAA